MLLGMSCGSGHSDWAVVSTQVMVCYIFKQFPDEAKKMKLAKSLLNSWVRDKDNITTYQMELVMQGAGHARQASHAIGASELEVGLWVEILVEERVGASYAMGASELVDFSPDLVAESSVMVKIFASQSDEVIWAQVAAQGGQVCANLGTHHDAGDPGGQVHARQGLYQDVRALSWQIDARGQARGAIGQRDGLHEGQGDGLHEEQGDGLHEGQVECQHEGHLLEEHVQGLAGGEHGEQYEGCSILLPSPDVAHVALLSTCACC